ncbi:hypothetical protein HanXRQr2_Chr15g0699401 [Helianthus annuus]|uniref:Uncharacterized protein n=1 Tax=Helianthus annuus TaxID=4232 RepID=A0A9K3E2V2_HELAN|nr:hypothetical protein HanXRQr2_Chr15g0699401 [Helianthus annuus]KAJ0831783.1 hypothetical protein HanPSC8_Chr15g0671091 [Helianthus annuus]
MYYIMEIFNLNLNCKTLLFNNNCKGIWILHDRKDNHSLSYMRVKQNDNMAANLKKSIKMSFKFIGLS